MTACGAESKALARLVPLAGEHLAATRGWINDPRVAEPFLFSRKIDAESHRRWYAQLADDETQSIFAVLDADGRHIGNLGFKQLDRHEASGEIWLYLGPESQGRGLGRDAVRHGIRIGFEQLCLRRIHLHVRADNHAARRIYELAGFSYDRSKQEVREFAGRQLDIHYMALGEAEWRRATGRGPKVALMQPMFLPWLHFFELMSVADEFVLLDDFQFSRNSWGHHVRLFHSPGRTGYASLPFRHPHSLAATFLDVQEVDNAAWRRKFLTSLRQTYCRAPYFDPVFAMLSDWLAVRYANIAEMEIAILRRVAGYLQIGTNLRRSSTLSLAAARRSERVMRILEALGAGTYYSARGSYGYMAEDEVFPRPDMPVYFQNLVAKPYAQIGSRAFVPGLSIVDALFNVEPREVRTLIRGTRWWRSWAEMRQACEDAEHCLVANGDSDLPDPALLSESRQQDDFAAKS